MSLWTRIMTMVILASVHYRYSSRTILALESSYGRRLWKQCFLGLARSKSPWTGETLRADIPLYSNRKPTSLRARSSTTRAVLSTENALQDPSKYNPSLEWNGITHSTSEFATHVLISSNEAPMSLLQAVERGLRQRQQASEEINAANETMADAAQFLIDLGSVWYLPAGAPRDPASGVKPTRLGLFSSTIASTTPPTSNTEATSPAAKTPATTILLQEGDYLRIHHNPRRFPIVHDYDWSSSVDVQPDNHVLHYNKETENRNERMPTSTILHVDDDTKWDPTRKRKKPGVIVAANAEKGWLIIDKPAGVPVHMTVDNARENVASCLLYSGAPIPRVVNDDDDGNGNPNTTGSAMGSSCGSSPLLLPSTYIATPQRLDQNTSGLLVVATSKAFAAYFAQLLRYKTAKLLEPQSNETTSVDAGDASASSLAIVGGIRKLYKCLVCIKPPDNTTTSEFLSSSDALTSWSVSKAVADLQSYANEEKVMRHFLEPSIRAPKRFVVNRPEATEWAEALLKIRKVSQVYPLIGNNASVHLAQSLWGNSAYEPEDDLRSTATISSVPDQCAAVVELEIELLTGRTHQIRGQMAASGYPLVGDTQYGGARPQQHEEQRKIFAHQNQQNQPEYYFPSERLALQCSALEFLDPDTVTQLDGTCSMTRSQRWNRFRLEQAWWTKMLTTFNDDATGMNSEQATTGTDDTSDSTQPLQKSRLPRPELLPPRVSLSPGKHKYVLLRAVHPSTPDTIEWFVKSASPGECGGPYHGNVAQDLREWVNAAGYNVTVTGGGRIEYNVSDDSAHQYSGVNDEDCRVSGRALVYGFSYGFGKGDHEMAAALIADWSKGYIVATVDNSPDLY